MISAALLVSAVLVLRFMPGGGAQVEDETRWAAAVLLAAAIMFVPVFATRVVTIPSRLHSAQAATITELQGDGDDISRIIVSLRELGTRNSRNERVTLDDALMELATDLAAGGISLPMFGSGPYRGFTDGQLEHVLGRLRIEGLLDVSRRTVESDKGHPYTAEDYYPSELGSKVVIRIEQAWEREFGED